MFFYHKVAEFVEYRNAAQIRAMWTSLALPGIEEWEFHGQDEMVYLGYSCGLGANLCIKFTGIVS